MGELEIPDLIRSGVVCTSWQSSYAIFRRLRLPSPRQSPCLLYSCDAFGPDAGALYCPNTGANFQIPFPDLRGLWPIGSGHGWLVVDDEAANLHLANPLTRACIALPPMATLHCIEGTALNEDVALVFNYRTHDKLTPIRVADARNCMYDRAALSCSPFCGGCDCVVLLLHSPLGELSFARPGDERWTWIPSGESTGLPRANFWSDASYNDKDGLFYVVNDDDSIYALDLKGPSPVATRIMSGFDRGAHSFFNRYLIHTPWGDLLQALRTWGEYNLQPPFTQFDDNDYNDGFADPLEFYTEELQLHKVDTHGQSLVKLDGVRGYALFLGYNGSMCLPVEEFPGLKPNSAYLMDDSRDFMYSYKYSKRDIGVWDFERQSLKRLSDSSPLPLKEPWLNWPAPIWVTPSLL